MSVDVSENVWFVVEAEGFDAMAEAELSYEALIAEGDPTFQPEGPRDEWDAICLNYLRP